MKTGVLQAQTETGNYLSIVAGPSQITLSLHNRRPAQDIIAIAAPQLPPKRIRVEKQCWKCFKPECKSTRAKRYCKNPYDDCNRVDCKGGIANDLQGPVRTRLVAQM
jgi:hypothetical protein